MKRSDFLKAFAALPFMPAVSTVATSEFAEDEAPTQYDQGPTQTMAWTTQDNPASWSATSGTVTTSSTYWLDPEVPYTYTSGTKP